MLKKFIARLRTREPAREDGQLYVTPERIRDIFAFGRKHGMTGFILSEAEAIGLARIIDWRPDAEVETWTIRAEAKAFKIGDQVSIPPHVKWSSYPHFRYIGIVNGTLEFRSGDNGESAWFLAQTSTDNGLIREIDTLFEFWHRHVSSKPIGKHLEEDLTDLGIATRDTPIRGFSVLSLLYPNHLRPVSEPYTALELATLLSRSMDIDWFAKEPEFNHYSVTAVQEGIDSNQDTFAFDFGPFDSDLDDFEKRMTVIVRETAGGGFMLLIDDVGGEHSAKIKALYDALPNQEYRLPGGRSHEVT